MVDIQRAHFILFVADQALSTRFYQRVLMLEPALYVPGMTEFELTPQSVLGLMPRDGISRLLGSPVSYSSAGKSGECYLVIDDVPTCVQRVLREGGTLLSPFQPRDWGHSVAYCGDIDGNILALAQIP
jgi:predicted enzyme related to lactoylglutathione lyase